MEVRVEYNAKRSRQTCICSVKSAVTLQRMSTAYQQNTIDYNKIGIVCK